jgi:hypothetical protein
MLKVDLTFGQSDTPAPLHAAFVELRDAVASLAGDRDIDTFTEVVWSALPAWRPSRRQGGCGPRSTTSA